MSEPKVTVLIPTYQRPLFLRRAIESVISQDCSDFLIRVFDNGSDPETLLLMKSLEKEYPNIEYSRHPLNNGARENFRRLISSVKTRYFLVMSDDDFLMQGHIRNGLEKLERYDDVQSYMSATITANLIERTLHFRNQTWIDGVYSPSVPTVRRLIREHFTLTGTIFRTEIRDVFPDFPPLGDDEVSCIVLGGIYKHYVSTKIGAVWTVNEFRPLLHSARRGTRRQLISSLAFAISLMDSMVDNQVKTILRKFIYQYYTRRLRLRDFYILTRRRSTLSEGSFILKTLLELRLILISMIIYFNIFIMMFARLFRRPKSLISSNSSNESNIVILKPIPRSADLYLVNAEIGEKQHFLKALDGSLTPSLSKSR